MSVRLLLLVKAPLRFRPRPPHPMTFEISRAPLAFKRTRRQRWHPRRGDTYEAFVECLGSYSSGVEDGGKWEPGSSSLAFSPTCKGINSTILAAGRPDGCFTSGRDFAGDDLVAECEN